MLRVLQDFRLAGISFGPLPVLLKVIVKGIGVLKAFYIASRTRVTIPIPSPTDPGPAFDGGRMKARFSQNVEGVEPSKSGANDKHISSFNGSHRSTS